jgi:hypothetical protein
MPLSSLAADLHWFVAGLPSYPFEAKDRIVMIPIPRFSLDWLQGSLIELIQFKQSSLSAMVDCHIKS